MLKKLPLTFKITTVFNIVCLQSVISHTSCQFTCFYKIQAVHYNYLNCFINGDSVVIPNFLRNFTHWQNLQLVTVTVHNIYFVLCSIVFASKHAGMHELDTCICTNVHMDQQFSIIV